MTSKPHVSRRLAESMMALCSIAEVTMWLPFFLYISATPLSAMLSDSVAPLVKMISRGSAPMTPASFSRASSTAFSASQP